MPLRNIGSANNKSEQVNDKSKTKKTVAQRGAQFAWTDWEKP
jgi:hypothetical protein